MLVTVRKNKLMSNRKHNQIVEQLFFSFGCKHKWREIEIEPVTKYYSYKLLEEVDPIVSDSRYIVKRGTMKYDLITYQNWSQFLISEKLKSCRFESFKDFLITSSPRIDKTCFEKDICNILVPWTRRMLC